MKPLHLLAILAASCAPPRIVAPSETAIVRMQRDVRFLASDDLKGRDNNTPEGAAAAEYVARRMKEIGLQPAGEDATWFQTIQTSRGARGRNVLGLYPSSSGRWVVLGAHHDGLGVRGGRIHNGADDNASGVAVLLEVARKCVEGFRSDHGLLFCSFDAEEDGLVGSNYFVKSGLHAIDSMTAMICLDLVGGSFLPGDERRVFALGSESSAALFDWIGQARGRNPRLEIERVGIYAIEPMGAIVARSDYSPFRQKKVPFVFVSTGTPWYYHQPEDDMERLDFAKMEAVADLVFDLAFVCARPEPKVEWQSPFPDYAEDAQLLASTCRRVLEHPAIRASDVQRAAVAEALEALDAEGKGRPQAIQRAMILLFEVAALQKPAH